jgi:hypothetical protein
LIIPRPVGGDRGRKTHLPGQHVPEELGPSRLGLLVADRQVQEVLAPLGVDAPSDQESLLRTLAAHGAARLLGELASDLKAEMYRPLPARRVYTPKPGSTEKRPLSLPAIRDRFVQAAVKIVIEPFFEADFRPASFGFRPKKAAYVTARRTSFRRERQEIVPVGVGG